MLAKVMLLLASGNRRIGSCDISADTIVVLEVVEVVVVGLEVTGN